MDEHQRKVAGRFVSYPYIVNTRANAGARAQSGLISADKVKGTSVYNRNRDKIGNIETVMIDKRSGEVGYAVMSFGGFLGIGELYHPLPWDALHYDEDLDGYCVTVARPALERAPTYTRAQLRRFDYANDGAAIDSYYGFGRFEGRLALARK